MLDNDLILALFKEQNQLLRDILTSLKNIESKENAVYKGVVDGVDAIRILNVHRTTLHRYRKDKRIKSKIIGKKRYYKVPDILKLKQEIMK